jgi:hypothetical protein
VHHNDHRDLITVDDDKIGHVVGEEGDYYLVEHGLLKSKHLVPKTFVEEKGDCYCTTLSKQLIYDSPKVNGDIDHEAVAQHYGLASGFDDPMTRGYGDVLPDDPARTAEEDAVAAGVDSGRERIATRKGVTDPNADRPKYDSPGITGGDRYRDAGARRSNE